jgi:pyruvate dehydrogenase E1 component alpha subunit
MDDEWRAKDPIDRIEKLLRRIGVFDDEFVASVQRTADDVAADLRRGCLETVEPAAMTVFDNVYADPHSLLDDERAQFASYQAGFEGVTS